jgi:tetratricopeptide (TPR) repeat protein
MFERHYDDEDIVALLESEREASDAHLPACALCSSKVESFRLIAGVLRESATWDQTELSATPDPATVATLRSFAERMTSDDERAAFILKELLAGPRETWTRRLREHPEWRTPGVVRRLMAAAYDAVVQMPPDAVAMMAMATDIADHLDTGSQPSSTLQQLRAGAWRDSAYALYYTGRFTDALAAVRRASEHLDMCVVDEYERARLGIVEALILRAFEKLDEGGAVAATSARTFVAFGDTERMASARMAEAQLLMNRGDYAAAESILGRLERDFEKTDLETSSRILGNLAFCSAKLGNVDLALKRYGEASAILRELGSTTEVLRIQWSIAVMLAEAGRHADACLRLRELTPEMERLGMASEAAIAALNVAESLLAQGKYAEVEELCANAMRSFEKAGLAYTPRALTALAYIREAASMRRADASLVKTVREYIRRLPAQPNLLFALPPE